MFFYTIFIPPCFPEMPVYAFRMNLCRERLFFHRVQTSLTQPNISLPALPARQGNTMTGVSLPEGLVASRNVAQVKMRSGSQHFEA